MRRPPFSGTLRGRIVATTAAFTTLGMLVLVALVSVVLAEIVNGEVTRSLSDRASAVSAVVERDGAGIRVLETTAESFDDDIWVFDADGSLVEGDRIPAQLAPTIDRLATEPRSARLEEEGWSLLARPLVFEGEAAPSGVVVVGVPLAPYRTTEAIALGLTLGVGLLVVAGVTLLAGWNVRRSLNPVSAMARAASEWSETDLTRRFALGEGGDEITRLGAVLDALLERVAQAIRAEQRLSAELAHELRTPLSVVRGEAELGLDDPNFPNSTRARLQRILDVADEMAEVIETLLTLARGEPGTFPESARAGDIIARVISDPEARPITAKPSSARVGVPLAFGARALAPLVENARRHRIDRVWIDVEEDADDVRFLVRDDGAGVPQVNRTLLFAPGGRGSGSPGAGLGLPLARRLARTAGGDVTHDGDDPTTFCLRLPKAPSPLL